VNDCIVRFSAGKNAIMRNTLANRTYFLSYAQARWIFDRDHDLKTYEVRLLERILCGQPHRRGGYSATRR